jgi:hypothetical protein
MNSSISKIVFAGLIAASSACAFAGAASAQSPDRLTDVAYIAAARCEGLAQGSKVDTTAIKSLLVSQDGGRNQYILDKADEVRGDAKRQASHAQGYTLQSINGELSGACQAYLKS